MKNVVFPFFFAVRVGAAAGGGRLPAGLGVAAAGFAGSAGGPMGTRARSPELFLKVALVHLGLVPLGLITQLDGLGLLVSK